VKFDARYVGEFAVGRKILIAYVMVSEGLRKTTRDLS
jgi:hypothetical protein